jgi:virulence-associated protein VapD
MSKYLITFDLDTTKLKTLYHGKNYNNAYYDIRSTLSDAALKTYKVAFI